MIFRRGGRPAVPFCGLVVGPATMALALSAGACGTPPDASGRPPELVGVVVAAPPRALGESWIAQPKLRVQLIEVRRDGPDVVSVSLTVRNEDRAPAALGPLFASADGDRDSLADMRLLDEAREKQYFVLRDDQGRPACSREIGGLAPGQQAALWARFPAPSADANQVTVVVPHAAPFRHVAIAPDRNHGR